MQDQIKENIGKREVKVFLSYAHKDEDIKDQLDTHMSGMKRSGKITAWNDREILEGEEWDAEIKTQLREANIILLLVSANFIASDYIWKYEVKMAMDRHEKKEAVVIPVIIKPCDWTDMPFAKIQALPKNAKPVTKHDDMDEAMLNVVSGIKRVVNYLSSKP